MAEQLEKAIQQASNATMIKFEIVFIIFLSFLPNLVFVRWETVPAISPLHPPLRCMHASAL